MKFFLDTEFSERGAQYPVTLISIGIVCEDGREMYAASSNYSASDCNEWVQANVLPHVGSFFQPLESIAAEVKAFVGDDIPEFWGYYSDYDWVVFAQMFGTMMDLPKGWPMWCRDIKQLCDDKGNPELPKQTSTEHNALADARWNAEAYRFLEKL